MLRDWTSSIYSLYRDIPFVHSSSSTLRCALLMTDEVGEIRVEYRGNIFPHTTTRLDRTCSVERWFYTHTHLHINVDSMNMTTIVSVPSPSTGLL